MSASGISDHLRNHWAAERRMSSTHLCMPVWHLKKLLNFRCLFGSINEVMMYDSIQYARQQEEVSDPTATLESWLPIVKPFLEPKTRKKVKFVYPDDANSRKVLEEIFDMDQLESAFGGNNTDGFDINKYAERMKEDDKGIPAL
ncbi:hypothetical protein Ancab_036354 [Ancistrocladus abbreviatus]